MPERGTCLGGKIIREGELIREGKLVREGELVRGWGLKT